MEKLQLTLQPRTVVGKKVKLLRAQGLVPAAISGKGVESQNFVTDARIFGRVYQRAGRTGLVELITPNGVLQGFIRQIQRHPITTVWLHVDFRVVDVNVLMTAQIRVVAVGENPLVERGDALVTLLLQALEVRALPNDIPQVIEVDISGITDFTTTLTVADLDIPANVQVLTPSDEPVMTFKGSTTSGEVAHIAEQVALGEPELAGEEVPEKTVEDTDKAVASA